MTIIQKDGVLVPDDFTGTIECFKVVVIAGRLLNIITKPIDPSKTFRMEVKQDSDGAIKRRWWRGGVELTEGEMKDECEKNTKENYEKYGQEPPSDS